MPPFFDSVQIHHALRNEAIPVLDAIAANQELHGGALGRFERDDPPPYASSTESEELAPELSTPPPDDVTAIMDPPLTDKERDDIAFLMPNIADPSKVYLRECKLEDPRVRRFRLNSRCLTIDRGYRRLGVLVRRNVKRRLEKLGIWNPSWGFPGRNVQPNDRADEWKWWWQPAIPSDSDKRQLVLRALSLRQNLRRGESPPVLPRSCLRRDASASQAESFITSRPWFLFQIEVAEEQARCHRLEDAEQCFLYLRGARARVVRWWRERGDWRDDFDEVNKVTSWKWRHESPSPEPEDFSQFDPEGGIRVDPLESIELTPSEIDALEAIDLPPSEQPKKLWSIWPGDRPPYYPGQIPDPTEGRSPSPPQFRPGPEDEDRLFRDNPKTTALIEEIRAPSGPRQDTSNASPQDPWPQRRRPRGQRADMDLDRQPPRRSARIAAMKRSAEPLPSQAAPNRKSRRTTTPTLAKPAAPQSAAPKARRAETRPVPGRRPANTETNTRPSRRRGHPRGENGSRGSSAVRKKAKSETTVTARTRSGRGRGA
ncbi:hypothetical protein HIM_05887 [Hirsutella minnesotensis 3608]|uniref:Uncharacterized protein n=1 Tax=Hirsutella minnesotensis 3608 TaxID=1043627 RepID=A0A0F7ZP27_9HYPO|nr:hypothetical protein HIM_05887 [Hirsutella minnesotensis 3608]